MHSTYRHILHKDLVVKWKAGDVGVCSVCSYLCNLLSLVVRALTIHYNRVLDVGSPALKCNRTALSALTLRYISSLTLPR